MTNMKNLGGATLMAAGVLALSPSAVSARIICNEWGQCWRVHGHYHPGWGWPVRPYPWRWQEEGDGYGGWASTRVMDIGNGRRTDRAPTAMH